MNPFSLFLCHAKADESAARPVAEYLARALPLDVSLASAALQWGETLVDRIDYALQSDLVILLLSPRSTPPRLLRSEWETAIDNERVACVRIEPCRYPALLERTRFFDLASDELTALRGLRQWAVSAFRGAQGPPFIAAASPSDARLDELETLRSTLADAPATRSVGSDRELALAFARACRNDFEEVLWVYCGNASPARHCGDLARQLRMPLPGPMEDDMSRLRETCAARRLLLVLDQPAPGPHPLECGGWCSVLRVERGARPAIDASPLDIGAAVCAPAGFSLPLAAQVAAVEPVLTPAIVPFDLRDQRYHLRADVPREPRFARRHAELLRARFAEKDEDDFADLLHACDWAMGEADDWPLAVDLSYRAWGLARAFRRITEGCEILERLRSAAAGRADETVEEYCSREMSWVLESWGRYEEAMKLARRSRNLSTRQLSLFDY